MCVAAAISGKLYCNLDFSSLRGGDRIYVFDTEQTRYHISQFNKRIRNILKQIAPGITDQEVQRRLKVYGLRPADSIEERTNFVIKEINDNRNEIGIVFIDGIRDLIRDINDSARSIEIVTKLMALATYSDVHIMLVLHTNKGDDNARGHIGTELENKCEAVIRIYMPADNSPFSVVEPVATRNLPFETFTFHVDETTGVPYLGDVDHDLIKKSANKKPEPDEIDMERYKDLAKDWHDLTTDQAMDRIGKFFLDLKLGRDKCKKYLHNMFDIRIIEKKPIFGKNAYLYSRLDSPVDG